MIVSSTGDAGSSRVLGAIRAKVENTTLPPVHIVSDALERHPRANNVLSDTFTVFNLSVFPKFIYPSVHGATQREKDYIFRILDGLPLSKWVLPIP